MAKTKKSTDLNVIAHEILQALTGEPSGTTSVKKISSNNRKTVSKKDIPEKNPAAVALGRLGGLKGGKARMEKLSAKRRAEIAKKAAMTRWKKS